jgi:hypothetical protein
MYQRVHAIANPTIRIVAMMAKTTANAVIEAMYINARIMPKPRMNRANGTRGISTEMQARSH